MTASFLKFNFIISKRIHEAVVPIERHFYHTLVGAIKSIDSHQAWSVQNSDNERMLEIACSDNCIGLSL